MSDLDLKVLAVIGISALTGMGLTSMLFQRSGEVESLDPEVKVIGVEVESVEVEGEWVEPEIAENAPQVAIRWFEPEAPIRIWGFGGIRPIRNPSPALWHRPTVRTGIRIPAVGSSFFSPFPSTWERSVAISFRTDVSPLVRWKKEGAGKPRSSGGPSGRGP